MPERRSPRRGGLVWWPLPNRDGGAKAIAADQVAEHALGESSTWLVSLLAEKTGQALEALGLGPLLAIRFVASHSQIEATGDSTAESHFLYR